MKQLKVKIKCKCVYFIGQRFGCCYFNILNALYCLIFKDIVI